MRAAFGKPAAMQEHARCELTSMYARFLGRYSLRRSSPESLCCASERADELPRAIAEMRFILIDFG
jgi:hypothetical protein